ncbi:SDR family oxidoreductase [Nitrosopumilus ureiphilus]|uniref:Short-chain dehydrogenase n=1 Tax=Nitrosopumilus ureiphilus TaxID=1470067 RepID=A0A7D5M6G3_9ARCH|nr:SDR family oxidoreductase [Nitrosopumilus ureiphilus]QLH05810.1 short-chain dehydrogenase [Nitrosopumilus ureiphilus]
MTSAIIIGGSRGIGKAIAESLKSIKIDVFAASKKDIDTSDLKNVKRFLENHNQTDILVLNTGGPAPKQFFEITEEDWKLYHNQLFLGFCSILQNIKINDGGYIFLISSSVIKEPNAKLIISSAYRAAFSEVLKILSKEYAQRNISCINIAPGPINTDRTKELIENVEEFEKSLPMKRLGHPEEIGNFVKGIIENKVKYLSGVTINFDGANSNYIF